MALLLKQLPIITSNNAVKNAELDVKFAKKQVLETVAIGLPKLNGEVNWQNFLELPNFNNFLDASLNSW